MVYANYRFWVIRRIKSRSIAQGSGCVEYQGNSGHKYGLISITADSKRKSVPASRAMYMAVNDCFGLPGSTQIRHKCDNMRCVNIEHLLAGTAKDNARDAIERGRRSKKYKPHTRHRIHDAATILAIRSAEGKYRWIAEEYSVSVGYVSKIKLRKAKALL